MVAGAFHIFGLPTQQPDDDPMEYFSVQDCTNDKWLLDYGHYRVKCTSRLGGHLIVLHDQYQDVLHRILQGLPGVTSTTDKHAIPTHAAVGAGPDGDQHEQGDIYLKLSDNSHLGRLCGSTDLAIDVSRLCTHDKHGRPLPGAPGHPLAGTPTAKGAG